MTPSLRGAAASSRRVKRLVSLRRHGKDFFLPVCSAKLRINHPSTIFCIKKADDSLVCFLLARALLADKGLTIRAFLHLRMRLVRADAHTVERTVFLLRTVVRAARDAAANVIIRRVLGHTTYLLLILEIVCAVRRILFIRFFGYFCFHSLIF